MGAIELFPYQETGIEWLVKRRFALLADEMGLGKSAQAICASDYIGARSILVFCPASARINWIREFKKFSNTMRHFKLITTKRDEILPGQSVVMSFDLAHAYSPKLNKDFQWDLVIIDEAHYLKSRGTHRTKSIFGKKGFIRHAKRVWMLSGTPAPNHPGELWPMLFTFGITKLAYDSFVRQFCTYYQSPFNKYGVTITGANTKALPILKNTLKPFMLRRLKKNVMKDLPPIIYKTEFVERNEIDFEAEPHFVQYVFPTDRRKEFFDKVKEQEKAISFLLGKYKIPESTYPALEALANSVSTLRHALAAQKVKSIAAILKKELESNEYQKVVVFAIHRVMIEGLRQELKDFKPVTLYGGTPPEKRQKHIDNFQNNSWTRVFIGNIQAAGTAITLTSAHNVVFAEQDWVPGNNAQAVMRCHRIGQENKVYVRFFACSGTIDERIASVLRKKTEQLIKLFDEEEETER